LVGNKIDLESSREVSTEEGKETAKQWKISPSSFIEVSACNSHLVNVS
jgi:GTPase SAR1 family protein